MGGGSGIRSSRRVADRRYRSGVGMVRDDARVAFRDREVYDGHSGGKGPADGLVELGSLKVRLPPSGEIGDRPSSKLVIAHRRY